MPLSQKLKDLIKDHASRPLLTAVRIAAWREFKNQIEATLEAVSDAIPQEGALAEELRSLVEEIGFDLDPLRELLDEIDAAGADFIDDAA